jgi:hypothetical protein
LLINISLILYSWVGLSFVGFFNVLMDRFIGENARCEDADIVPIAKRQ